MAKVMIFGNLDVLRIEIAAKRQRTPNIRLIAAGRVCPKRITELKSSNIETNVKNAHVQAAESSSQRHEYKLRFSIVL
jgi:hypothetical protein